MNEVRIGVERFKGLYTVTIGLYPPRPCNYFYGAKAETEDKSLSAAVREAVQQWREIRTEEREDGTRR